MKIVVYGPERRVGALVGDQVVDLNRAYAKYLTEKQGEGRAAAQAAAVVPADLQGLVESGARGLEGAQQALDYLNSGAQDKTAPDGATIVRALSAVKLQPPVPGPGSRIACGGANYAKHSAGMRRTAAWTSPSSKSTTPRARTGQWGFWKISRPILGPDDT